MKIEALGRGWYNVNSEKVRMKKEDADAMRHLLVPRSGKFSAKKPSEPEKVVRVKIDRPENDEPAEMTPALQKYLVNHPDTKLTIITCKECGKARYVKVQDQFQVCRCIKCSQAYKNEMRRLRRAEKKAEAQK